MSLKEFRMPSGSVRPGDIVTDKGRHIQITDVKDARISYRGFRFPVRYFTGVDVKVRDQKPVRITVAHKGLWTVTRAN
jgi:hypothetical protein